MGQSPGVFRGGEIDSPQVSAWGSPQSRCLRTRFRGGHAGSRRRLTGTAVTERTPARPTIPLTAGAVGLVA